MRRAAIPTALIAVLAAGCASVQVRPAEPPGSAAAAAEAAEARAAGKKPPPEGIDGSVQYDQPGLRDKALRNIRAFCMGPFVIVEEREKVTMTPLSFPFPVERHTIYFRCGQQEDGG